MVDGLDINIENDVLSNNKDLISLRRDFHKHPEPSLKEYKTSEKIKNQLKEYNIDYEEIGETGVIATIVGKKKNEEKENTKLKTVLLRGDMDALNVEDKTNKEYSSVNKGISHACGHDGHTASLLIAAKVLKERENDFKGKIKLLFQQAEEIGAGARLFVKAGCLKDVDGIFGIHLSSYNDVGEVVAASGVRNAACDKFKIIVKGEGTHASHITEGRDALLTAVSIVKELQLIIPRKVKAIEPAALLIGVIKAGTSYNIMASEGIIEGTLRTVNDETRAELLKEIEDVAKKVASIHNTSVEFDNYNAAYQLFNDDKATEFAGNVARKIVGDKNVITEAPISLGAEDFADLLKEVPGTFLYVGSRNPENPETAYPHHHEKFDIDERSLIISTQLHINYALSFLELYKI